MLNEEQSRALFELEEAISHAQYLLSNDMETETGKALYLLLKREVLDMESCQMYESFVKYVKQHCEPYGG